MSEYQLLLHGLKANDKSVIEPQLEKADEEFITDSVKKLPSDTILPLMKVIQNCILKSKLSHVLSYVIWLKAIIHHHLSYLVFLPGYNEIMASINNTIKGKEKN